MRLKHLFVIVAITNNLFGMEQYQTMSNHAGLPNFQELSQQVPNIGSFWQLPGLQPALSIINTPSLHPLPASLYQMVPLPSNTQATIAPIPQKIIFLAQQLLLLSPEEHMLLRKILLEAQTPQQPSISPLDNSMQSNRSTSLSPEQLLAFNKAFLATQAPQQLPINPINNSVQSDTPLPTGKQESTPASTQEEAWICKNCSKEYASKRCRVKHQQKIRECGRNGCKQPLCNKLQRLEHDINFHNYPKLKCAHCKKKYKFQKNLTKHELTLCTKNPDRVQNVTQ